MAMAEMKRAETGVMVPPEDRAPLTFFEGIAFKLRDKGAMAGDNTIRQRIGELTNDIRGRGDFFIAHAKEYLRCFQPVAGVKFTNTTDVPTLFDQLKPTLEQFDKDRQREVLEYLVHDVTRSIVEKKQPRPTKSGRPDVLDATRKEASGFLEKLEDVIMERVEPTPVAGQTPFDRFMKVPVRASEAVGLIYLGLKLGACTPIQPTISPDITPPGITQTVPAIETPSPTEFQPTLTPSGPETTPVAPAIYPASFTVETASASIARVSEAPSTITGIGEVQAIIKKHTELANAKGLVFDHMEVEYSAADQRWFLYPADGNGNIVGWLYIADASSQTGWRPAEQPTWDSQFAPSTDQYKYDLPELSAGNHWAVGVQNGYPILIEMDHNNSPVRWLDVAKKQMDEVQGAVIHAEVNPATSATLWPAEVQARFKDVLTDPWTVTAAQKAEFDTYLTTQWQLTLKDAGVANAEKLQGYDLLNAIIEHLPAITLTGSETPEQLAAYVVELPFSLHKLIRTDQASLVPLHHEAGRYVEGRIDSRPNSPPPEQYRGPLQKNDNDWGYYYASYGIGYAGVTLEWFPFRLNMLANAPFYGETIHAASTELSVSGDMVLLFTVPGVDPRDAVGTVIRMYNGNKTQYTEMYIPLTNTTARPEDLCLSRPIGQVISALPCGANQIIETQLITDLGKPKILGPVTLQRLLKLMALYTSPYVTMEGASGGSFLPAWKDGMEIAGSIETTALPSDFFNK